MAHEDLRNKRTHGGLAEPEVPEFYKEDANGKNRPSFTTIRDAMRNQARTFTRWFNSFAEYTSPDLRTAKHTLSDTSDAWTEWDIRGTWPPPEGAVCINLRIRIVGEGNYFRISTEASPTNASEYHEVYGLHATYPTYMNVCLDLNNIEAQAFNYQSDADVSAQLLSWNVLPVGQRKITAESVTASDDSLIPAPVDPPAYSAPVADAGADQIGIAYNATVNLDGSGSTVDTSLEPPLSIASYAWTQTAGTAVSLTGATTATPSFDSTGVSGTLTFQLTITDSIGQTDTDTVNITIPTLLYYTGFEDPPFTGSGATINGQDSWTCSLAIRGTVQTDGALAYAGTQYLQLLGTGATFSVGRTVNPATALSKIYYNFRFWVGTGNSRFWIDLMDGATITHTFTIFGDEILWDASATRKTACTDGSWHQLKVVYNQTTDTFDGYLDDMTTAKFSGLGIDGPASKFNKIQFRSYLTTGVAFRVDELIVREE